MIKTMALIVAESFATAMIIIICLKIFGFSIVQNYPEVRSSVVRKDVMTGDESFPHHRWCYEAKNLKPDDFCIQGIAYREYQATSDDPMMNFRLYGVKLGEESRAAVGKGETRILGGEKVPICKVADKYDAPFCYNDEKMEAHLVARNDKGQTVIVWATDYHDVRKGFMFELMSGTR